jgi:ABC-type sugar transport system ATPase subunit
MELALTATEQMVRLDAVTKVYGAGQGAVVALDSLTLGFDGGSFTAVMGPSGSGKSTFLNVAAGLDRPDQGTVWLGGADIAGYSEAKLTELRRERVGFVFQAFNLMPSLTVSENIALPVRLGKGRLDRDWVDEIVARSAWQSLAPSSLVPTSCSRTSRPARSTPPPAARCSSCSARSSTRPARRSSWSPTTRWPPRTPTVSSS